MIARPKFRQHRVIVLRTIPILLWVCPFSLSGQNPGEEANGGEALQDSLALDIATSRREQLVAWNRILGLSTAGTDERLRSQLTAYYGIPVGGTAAGTSVGKGTRVVIESAGRSEYFQVDLDDGLGETVVRLSGGVVIRVDEDEGRRNHRVQADSVIFNENRNAISAVGNIVYVVDTAGREERFTGDSLVFQITDWTGVILRGTSERQEEIDEKTIDFFFRGESIKRSGPEILVLTEGTITSHDTETPDYSLRARKIWITGPGEWGLLNATLYVGHIPVFYLPFYWKAGRDLFFNPVIGFRSSVGYYIQTTIYLLGRKKQDDDFSMFGFGNSAGGDYALEPEGMYLVRIPGSSRDSADTGTLKFMLDGYTSLGAMTGLTGSFPNLGENSSIDFHLSLGVSRSVDSTGNPFFNDGSNARAYWNKSYIGSVTVPFRWGAWTHIKLDSWSLKMDWYSDPYYRGDFRSRKENFDWLSFLLGEEGSGKDNAATATTTGMNWELTGSRPFEVSDLSPWVQSFSLNRFRAALSWATRSNPEVISSSDPDKAYNPARTFFYPKNLVVPDILVSMRGALPGWRINRIETRPENPVPSVGSREVDEGAPAYRDSFDAVYNGGLLDAAVSYGIQSQLYADGETNNASWNAPSDVDYSFKAVRIKTIHQGNINYGLDFWDGLTGVGGSTKLSGYYQVHGDIFGSGIAVAESTRLVDYKYSKFLWDNTFSAYVRPLHGVSSLDDSELKYSFDGNIYSFRFKERATATSPAYSGHWIDGADDIKRHQVALSLDWKPQIFFAYAKTQANIPPLDQRYAFQLGGGLSHKGWKADIIHQSVYEKSSWDFQPLKVSAFWTGWKDEVTISQSASFDLGNQRLSTLDSRLKLWGFQAQFTVGYGSTFSWNSTSYVWNARPDAFRPSRLIFSYKRTFEPNPMWKNRIRTQTVLDTRWSINLVQSTDNILTFKWTQAFHIHRFLDLKISFSSTNRSMYLYFPWWRDQLGINRPYNFFEDLGKSFNLFNPQHRLESQFNMDRIDVKLIHHLRNWDVILEYSGWPALESGAGVYRWKSEFSLFVKWNPLPMFNQKTTLKRDRWTVESFE